jgi:hypothetical protein
VPAETGIRIAGLDRGPRLRFCWTRIERSRRSSASVLQWSFAFGAADFVRILTLAPPKCLLGCLDDERVGYRSEINDLLRENAEDFERLFTKCHGDRYISGVAAQPD